MKRELLKKWIQPIAFFLIGVFFGAGALVAVAQSSIIHACVIVSGGNGNGNNSIGSIRIVSASNQCTLQETYIFWNQTGPQGIQGLQGIPGIQGPQGVQGIAGTNGTAGLDGISCWDLNANHIADTNEDINGDLLVDALDCRGPQGLPAPSPVNADTVDGFHAAANPLPNSLLALDVNGLFPNSIIPQGSGSGLDADTIDGLDSSSFSLSNHNHDAVYVNEGRQIALPAKCLSMEQLHPQI